jgi:hypothetical protein
MWNRSVTCDGDLVVGAKKLAREKKRDRSINAIKEGASLVTPINRTLLSSIRNSVT